ncbi:MAG: hypothetical protein WBV82_05365 [Myxococcaceae bacterium]
MFKPFLKSVLPAALLISSSALAFQPTLRNEDSKTYRYELQCGGSTTQSSIGGSTNQTLRSGCTIKVKGAGSAKLSDDMRCRIKDSMLECD